MAELDLTNIASTSIATPGSGVTAVFVDSTTVPTKRLKTRDDAGLLIPYVGQATTDTGANRLQNKDLDAATTNIVDGTDTTKKVAFTASGASTGTVLTVADAQTTSQTLNVPNIATSSIIVTDTLAQNITGVKTMTNMTTLAGTNAVPSMTLTHGTNLTSAVADAVENDAIAGYLTTNTTDGRGHIPTRQHFRLTSNGGSITTIANWFGATSNISLVASAYYYIDIVLYGLKSSTGDAVTFTLTNSAAPTSQNIYYEQSPNTGIVAPPGSATALVGQIVNDATAAKTIVTGALTLSVNHYFRMRIELKNGTGTSLKIQATNATGITPLLGSYWTATRLPTGNTGTFAA